MSSGGSTSRNSIVNIEDWLDRCLNEEPDSIIYEPDTAATVAVNRALAKQQDLERLYKIAMESAGSIGLNSEMIEERLSDIDQCITTFLNDLERDLRKDYDKLCAYQQTLLNQIQKMLRDLHLPEYVLKDNMTLLQTCKDLKHKHTELDKIREKRMSSWQELRDKQTRHCLILGIKAPALELQTDIPTEDELKKLANAVSDLEKEEKRRRDKYNSLKEAILLMMVELEHEPQDEFEQSIETAMPNYTESHLLAMTSLHSKLEAKRSINNAKFVKFKETLDSLYERLDVPQAERDMFFRDHNVCKPSIMAEMEVEIEKYQLLKRQNIGKFISKIKDELVVEYERCFIAQEEQDGFFALSAVSDECTEQLLELHERELDRIKRFYTNNKQILDKFAKWQQMWNELIQLELKANDPNRFTNRGGQLLIEERKRKSIQKGLPKIEAELNTMNEQYSSMNQGKKFKVFGTNMDEFISGCWDELNQAKEVEKMERKQAKLNPKKVPVKRPAENATPTPSKQRFKAHPSSTKSTHNQYLVSSNVTLCEREFDQMISQCPSSAKRVL